MGRARTRSWRPAGGAGAVSLLAALLAGGGAPRAEAGWETVQEFYGTVTIHVTIDHEADLGGGQRHILRKKAFASVRVTGSVFDGAYYWPVGTMTGTMETENHMINADGSAVRGKFSGRINRRFDGEHHGGPELRVNKEKGLYKISLPHLYATGTGTTSVSGMGPRSNPNAEDEARPFLPDRYRQGVEYDPEAGFVAGGFTHPEELPYYPKPMVITTTANWHFDFELPPLDAEAGDMVTVERGGTATLDGSGSKGRIEKYRWRLEPADCPGEAKVEATEKEGETIEVRVLCPLLATLTVSDGVDTDEDETAVVVEPRDWETGISESPDEIPMGDSGKPWGDKRSLETRYFGGENVCAYEGSPQRYHNFHPMRVDDSWEGGGYTLELIRDTGGPFDGFWYLSEYKLEIKRAIAVNPYLREKGPPLLAGNPNLYSENVAAGTQFPAYLAAIRAHEHDHTVLKETALTDDNDPAKEIEDDFSRERDWLKEQVDWEISNAERQICERSSDPMPGKPEKKFLIQIRDQSTHQPFIVEVCVGGRCEKKVECPD